MSLVKRWVQDDLKDFLKHELGASIKSAVEKAVHKKIRRMAFDEASRTPFHWDGNWMRCKGGDRRFRVGEVYWVGVSDFGYWAYPDYEHDESRSWIPRQKIDQFFEKVERPAHG